MSAFDTAPRTVVLPGGRVVGYRRFGNGPPVALLHASPRSAAASVPLGLRLADRCTVFAFDNPGFGWSDPLPLSRPDAADFGDALVEAFDALGIERAPVYGSHTGAAIAVAAASRHPDRVPALALDGYAMFTPTQQAEYLATYLAPIRPSWDGTHLAFLWSRVKDQFTVFPWYLNGDVARIPRKLVPLETMQGVIVDFLAAGDNYRPGYAAAFRFNGNVELQALRVPTTVMARSDDLLFSHLDALHDMPSRVQTQRLGEDHAAWADAVHAALSCGASSQDVSPAPDPRIMRVPGGTIGIIRQAAAEGRTVVILPGIPGSARAEAGLARALAEHRSVCVVDLPGFGGSVCDPAADAGAIARMIAAALLSCGIESWDVVGIGESDGIAAALRARHPGSLVLIDPVPDGERAEIAQRMVDVTPRSDGAHLLAAWHQLRDARFWRPWFACDPEHGIPAGTDPDVVAMHAVFTDWMRGGVAGRATLAASMQAPALTAAPALLLTPGHPWSVAHAAVAEARGWPIAQPEPDRHARAAAILRLLGSAA